MGEGALILDQIHPFSQPALVISFDRLLRISGAMAVQVLIPTALQKFTGEKATIECVANNVGELIENLEESCPGIKNRLCDDSGQLRRFLNFYVNSEDIRFLEGTNTPLKDGDEVSIVPAVAGG